MRMGWAEYIYGMLVIDFLILNRDRHGQISKEKTILYRIVKWHR